jgi:MYXO-CTERM domain-containing protein
VLPAVQASSGSTDGELGAALLMIGLGALVFMRLTDRPELRAAVVTTSPPLVVSG